MKTTAVGLIQMRMGSDKGQNLREACDRIAEAASRGANLIVLPELFLTPYFCQKEDPALFDLAEPIPGPSTARLGVMARQAGLFLSAGLLEKDPGTGHLHNASVLLAPDGTLRARYRKVFLYLGERDQIGRAHV